MAAITYEEKIPFVPIDKDDSTKYYSVSCAICAGGTVLIGEVGVDESNIAYTTRLFLKNRALVAVKCDPYDGYVFDHWTVSGGTPALDSTTLSEGGSFIVRGTATVSAVFTKVVIPRIISVTQSTGGNIYIGRYIDDVSYTSINAYEGNTIYVKCVPNEGYIFKEWYIVNGTPDFSNNLTSATDGILEVGTTNITISGIFTPLWVDDSDDFKRLNASIIAPYTGGTEDAFLTYITIVVDKDNIGEVILKAETEYNYDGIYLATSKPNQWTGPFYDYDDACLNSSFTSCNSLYSGVNSFVTGEYNDEGVIILCTKTIKNIPSGTYYIVYRRDVSARYGNDYVSYKFTQIPILKWISISDTSKRIDGISSGEARLSKDKITVDVTHKMSLTLKSETSSDFNGVFLVKDTPQGVNNWVGEFTEIGNSNNSLYNSSSYVYNNDIKTIADIPSGSYYVVYRQVGGCTGYAQYNYTIDEIIYTVRFNAGDGILVGDWSVDELSSPTHISSQKNRKYQSDEYKYVGLAKRDGYIFNGWYTSPSNGIQVYDSNGKYCSPLYFDKNGRWIYTASITLYAQWTPCTYYIKYDPNCITVSGSMNNSTHIYDTPSTLNPVLYARKDYVFLNWNTEENNEGTSYGDCGLINIKPEKNNEVITIYAQWQKEESYDEDRDTGLINDYNKMSAYSIKSSINRGQVEYVKNNDNESSYEVKIVDPDSIDTLDILSVSPVMKSGKTIINSVEVTRKSDTNNLNLKIINRYSGYYNPIFKDILFYNDYLNKPFIHTSFDDDYEDGYGKFGIINNMWFHKVNDEGKNVIGTEEPKYPLTGEYALDFRDYNIFSTNWDMNYYTKQLDISHNEKCRNIGSMKEGLSMFGSKYLHVPNEINIETFTDGGEWNNEWINNSDGCPGEVMYKEVNDNNVNYYFFIRKRLIRFFYEKLKPEFEKYINPEYSYGTKTLDDDIKEYVSKNILKLYELKKIRVFVKRVKKGVANNSIENDYCSNLGLTVSELKKEGFKEINNVSLSKKGVDDFDRQLTYNLRNGEQEFFGFSILIKKI